MIGILGLFSHYIVTLDILLIFLNLFSVVILGVILYSLSEANDMKDISLLSFVPVGNIYIINKLLGNRVNENYKNYLWLIYGVFYFLSLFVVKLGIVSSLIIGFYTYLLMKEFKNENLFIHTVLAVITNGISLPFVLYKYRNNIIEDDSRKDRVTVNEFINKIKNYTDEE